MSMRKWITPTWMISGCLIGLLAPSAARACKVVAMRNTGIFASYERKLTQRYGKTELTQVNGCKTPGKYLMIGIGAEQQTYDSVFATNFGLDLFDSKCRIVGAEDLRLDPFEKVRDYYRKKTRFVSACVRTLVVENSGNPIDFPDEQSDCRIRTITPDRIELAGHLCFLRPSATSNYSISHYFAPECLSREGLAAQGISPMDVPTVVNYYLAGDATGTSTDLRALASSKIRFSVDPGPELMRVSEDLGDNNPRWPSSWAPDIHIAGLTARGASEERVEFRLSFLVDNTCAANCRDGLCAGPCDYSVPVAAEVTLTEVDPRGKRSIQDSFFMGGLATGQWQGILSPAPRILSEEQLRPGHAYEALVVFNDPYDDYYALVNQVDQMLINLGTIPYISAGIGSLTGINSLDALRGLQELPPLPALTPLVDENTIPKRMTTVLEEFGNLFKFPTWPAYYDRFCDPGLRRCKRANDGRNVAFKVEFRVEGKDGSDYRISPLKVKRASPILTAYERIVNEPARVECGDPDEEGAEER